MNLRSILEDEAPAEPLPRAMLRPRGAPERRAWLRGAAARWLAGRLAWLRPRAAPLAFAVAGTLGILATMGHLARPPRPAADAGGRPAAHHPVRLTIIVAAPR